MKSKQTKQRRSPRLTAVDRRLIETLAAFANLKAEDVPNFRAGVLKSSERSRSQNVLANFLPEICWELPAPSPPPGSPALPEGLLGWQEIQRLVRDVWDSRLPFRSHQSAYNKTVRRLELYSMIAALPDEEREKLRLSIRDPFPPEPGPYSEALAEFEWRIDHEPGFREESRRRPYSSFNYIYAPDQSSSMGGFLVGPPREPRADEYMRISLNVFAKRLREGEMPSLELIEGSDCPCELALWFMLFNGWRAKTCSKCRGRYIALEQQSRYCSNDCSYAYRMISNRDSRNKCWAKNREKYNLARQKAKKR